MASSEVSLAAPILLERRWSVLQTLEWETQGSQATRALLSEFQKK